jgi:hypothetical protein
VAGTTRRPGRLLPRSLTTARTPAFKVGDVASALSRLRCVRSLHRASTSSSVTYQVLPATHLGRPPPMQRTAVVGHGRDAHNGQAEGVVLRRAVSAHDQLQLRRALLHLPLTTRADCLRRTTCTGWLDRRRPEETSLASHDPHAPLSNSFRTRPRAVSTATAALNKLASSRTRSQSLAAVQHARVTAPQCRCKGMRWHWAALKHARCTST